MALVFGKEVMRCTKCNSAHFEPKTLYRIEKDGKDITAFKEAEVWACANCGLPKYDKKDVD